MRESDWTLGPWQVSGIRVKLGGEPVLHVGPDSHYIAAVYYGNGSTEQHRAAHADARLIAAAPDMAAVLIELLDDFDEHPQDFTEPWHRARAALARARGEQP